MFFTSWFVSNGWFFFILFAVLLGYGMVKRKTAPAVNTLFNFFQRLPAQPSTSINAITTISTPTLTSLESTLTGTVIDDLAQHTTGAVDDESESVYIGLTDVDLVDLNHNAIVMIADGDGDLLGRNIAVWTQVLSVDQKRILSQ